MDSKQQTVEMLIEMGFGDAEIKQAIDSTNSTSIEVLITYLESQQQPQQQQQQQQQVQGEGQSISGLVDQELVGLLMSLGHSKIVAEKSILLSDRKGKEAALAWIEEHKNDADLEEELRMMQEQKQTPEEINQKVKELQQRIREKRKKDEEQTALEQERNRLKSGKQMTDVRREIEEQKRRLDAEAAKRERLQLEKDKQKALDDYLREKEARFGKSFRAPGAAEVQAKKYTQFELFEIGIKQIKVAQPPDLIPDVAWNSLNLINKIIENIIKNPAEPKFRKIQLTSQAYTTKIDQVFGAKSALDALGFVEQEGYYVLHTQDMKLLNDAISVVQKEIQGF